MLHAHDPLTGLKAIVILYNTRFGPAFGGCRMYPCAEPGLALADALRLSRGMIYKAAICELPSQQAAVAGLGPSLIEGAAKTPFTTGRARKPSWHGRGRAILKARS